LSTPAGNLFRKIPVDIFFDPEQCKKKRAWAMQNVSRHSFDTFASNFGFWFFGYYYANCRGALC